MSDFLLMEKKELSWFVSRIGETIYKTPSKVCGCQECQSKEVCINDFNHAERINMHQNESDVMFFDTKTELAMHLTNETIGLHSEFVYVEKPQPYSNELTEKEEVDLAIESIIATAAQTGIIIKRLNKSPYFSVDYLENDWRFKTIYSADHECFVIKSFININKNDIFAYDLPSRIAQDLELNNMVVEALNSIVEKILFNAK